MIVGGHVAPLAPTIHMRQVVIITYRIWMFVQEDVFISLINNGRLFSPGVKITIDFARVLSVSIDTPIHRHSTNTRMD